MLDLFDPVSGITITGRAVDKIYDIAASKEYIRIFIEGGGCSGFMYQFDVAYRQEDDDIKFPDLNLLIDPLSYQYINGSVIDYVEDLMGAKFIVKNPNATNTCGCGQSFSI